MEIELEEIRFAGLGEFERFVKWIEEKVAQGQVEELERIEKNEFRPLDKYFSKSKDHRYFRMLGDHQVWILCDFDGPAHAFFVKYDPNFLY